MGGGGGGSTRSAGDGAPATSTSSGQAHHERLGTEDGSIWSGWVARGVVRQAHQGRRVRSGCWVVLGPPSTCSGQALRGRRDGGARVLVMRVGERTARRRGYARVATGR